VGQDQEAVPELAARELGTAPRRVRLSAAAVGALPLHEWRPANDASVHGKPTSHPMITRDILFLAVRREGCKTEAPLLGRQLPLCARGAHEAASRCRYDGCVIRYESHSSYLKERPAPRAGYPAGLACRNREHITRVGFREANWS
jgi:hypothetical protein